MKKYDAIIIGAGIGGLTSALMLARKGVRVALLENQSRAGGCCTSFTVKGFTFDACVDSIGALGEGEPLRRIMQDELGIWDKLKFHGLDPVRRNFFPDFTIDIPVGLKKYEEELSRYFPAESEGIKKVLSVMDKIYQVSLRSMLNNGAGGEDLVGYINMSFYDLLSSYVTDKKLQAVLSSYCTFLGLPGDEVSVIVGANILMHYLKGGAYRVNGGIQKLVNTMVEEIQSHGGEVFLNEEVLRISRMNGAGYSVITKGNHNLDAKQLISNIALKKSFELMGMEQSFQKSIDAAEVSGSFVVVYLGITGELASSGIGASAGYFESYSLDAMLNKNGVGSFGLSVHSLLDKSLAPEGHSTLSAALPYCSIKRISKDDRERIGDQIMKRLDRVLPGIEKRVVYKTVSGPDTIERYTGNTLGAAYGWRQGKGFMKNLAFLRNLPDNFHVVGHWSGYGGGVMSSMLSAYRVVNNITK